MPDSNDMQRRFTRSAGRIDLKARSDGAPSTIVGYAAVFYDPSDPGTEYRLWDDMVERIMPGAFDRALRENDDVRALFNHDSSQILGRREAGTLRLSVDKRGLRYEIDPPDTQAARDLLISLERRDITGSSFMFRPKDTTYRIVDGVYVLERNDLHLFDVGPVAFPAYTSTEAMARSTDNPDHSRKEVQQWLRSQTEGARRKYTARAAAVEIQAKLSRLAS